MLSAAEALQKSDRARVKKTEHELVESAIIRAALEGRTSCIIYNLSDQLEVCLRALGYGIDRQAGISIVIKWSW